MTPLSKVPNVYNPAAAQAGSPCPLERQAAPFTSNAAVAGPGDLVARALMILAEETEAWQARRAPDLPPGSTR